MTMVNTPKTPNPVLWQRWELAPTQSCLNLSEPKIPRDVSNSAYAAYQSYHSNPPEDKLSFACHMSHDIIVSCCRSHVLCASMYLCFLRLWKNIRSCLRFFILSMKKLWLLTSKTVFEFLKHQSLESQVRWLSKCHTLAVTRAAIYRFTHFMYLF